MVKVWQKRATSKSTHTHARSLHSRAVSVATLSPQIPGPANRICKHDFALSVNSDNGNGGDGGLGRRISAPQAPRDADWTPATTTSEPRAPIPLPAAHTPPDPASLPWKCGARLRVLSSTNHDFHVHAAINHGDATTCPEEVRFPARAPDSPRCHGRPVRLRGCGFAACHGAWQEMQRER